MVMTSASGSIASYDPAMSKSCGATLAARFRLCLEPKAHALVELAHATLGHGRLVSTVDLGDVVALDGGVLGAVHGEEAGERDLQNGSAFSITATPPFQLSLTVKS
mgnify:CR=1 FL=1